jgi:hydrogenase expression/formation protein HypC
MCLAVPGQIIEIEESAGVKIGKVSFGAVTKRAMLSLVPEAHIGDYVMVQAGIATSIVDKEQVDEILRFIKTMEELEPGT